MKVVVQRSKAASVTVSGEIVGSIPGGLVLLVGVGEGDTEQDARYIAEKVAGLRIFEDEHGKMNLSVLDTGGQVLSISQFTLYGDCTKGKRPNFMAAARPEKAEPLYESFNEFLRQQGLHVEIGRFGEMMEVALINDGPVTLILESQGRGA
ncbi:D-aminoacyl-tRNA deacylase [Paenibacillus puerhi]|uniref:D-aminoacyl-tRNA deacylase n=1 Tax=Paenibacillus puerhi TaxID=2692622 RepID=UPI001357CF6C|nr:D-aminoacyl-tRNA deacylase [Paenibacillus puerhi]